MPRRLLRLAAPLLLVAGMLASAGPALGGELGYGDVDLARLMGWLMSGQPEGAIQEADRMINGLRQTDDPNNVHLIGEILTFRCEAQNALGQYREAEASCLEAIAMFEEAEKDVRPGKWHREDGHIARALSQLATSYLATGKFESALEASGKQLERTASAQDRATVLTEIGDLQRLRGRFREAENSYLDAIAAQAEVRRDERKMRSDPHVHLARLYLLEERFGRAEAIVKEGLADAQRTRAVLSERHAKFGIHTHDLKANAHYLQVLSQEMAWTYYHQQRYDEARRIARDVLAYYEAERMFFMPLITDVRILLARIEDAGEPGSLAARRYLESAVGPGGSDLTRAIAQLEFARHHLLNRNDKAAEPYATMAAKTLRWIEGEESRSAALAEVILARVLQQQGKHSQALPFALAAYVAQRQVLPPYHSETGETLALLIELYEALGRRDDLAATRELIAEHKTARAKFESSR